jgi:hypothetical protein
MQFFSLMDAPVGCTSSPPGFFWLRIAGGNYADGFHHMAKATFQCCLEAFPGILTEGRLVEGQGHLSAGDQCITLIAGILL